MNATKSHHDLVIPNDYRKILPVTLDCEPLTTQQYDFMNFTLSARRNQSEVLQGASMPENDKTFHFCSDITDYLEWKQFLHEADTVLTGLRRLSGLPILL